MFPSNKSKKYWRLVSLFDNVKKVIELGKQVTLTVKAITLYIVCPKRLNSPDQDYNFHLYYYIMSMYRSKSL